MSITDHVPIPLALRLPPQFEDVTGILQLHDPDLRIRRSLDNPHLYVLERRCRRAPAVNIGMWVASDMHLQARDGYIHVAITREIWLTKPWNIIHHLKHQGADLWASGGAAAFADECEYEEAWGRETRRRRRIDYYRAVSGEAFDHLNRLNTGSRTRMNNVGTTALTGP